MTDMLIRPDRPAPDQGETTGEAEVRAWVENRAIAGGSKKMLLRRADGAYALGREIGGVTRLESMWVTVEFAIDVAMAVAGGHQRSCTAPETQLGLAVALLAVGDMTTDEIVARMAKLAAARDEVAAALAAGGRA